MQHFYLFKHTYRWIPQSSTKPPRPVIITATCHTTAGLAPYASAAASWAPAASSEWQEESDGESAWEKSAEAEREAAKTRQWKSEEKTVTQRAPLSLLWFDKSYYFIISPWAESWASLHTRKQTHTDAFKHTDSNIHWERVEKECRLRVF